MQARRRSELQEVASFLILVAAPLVITPFTNAPFVDGKLLLLTVAGLLFLLSRPRIDRRIACAGLAWLMVLAISTAFSVDPLWSLLGSESRGIGLLALAASIVALCAGTGLDETLRARIPGWLVWTGVVVAFVAVVGRFVNIGGADWQLGALSSTLGHRVFVGGFIAAAVIASTTLPSRRAHYFTSVVLGSGLSVSASRAAWIGCALGLAVAGLTDPTSRADVIRVAVVVAIVLAAWTAADPLLPAQGIAFSAAPRFGDTSADVGVRTPVWRADVRAIADRPFFGYGMGTTWYAYLSHARASEIRQAGRGVGDAHDMFVEVASASGTLGLLGLLILILTIGFGAWRAPPSRRWAFAAAASLGVTHLVEPLNLNLTPLLFLCAGLAVADTGRSVTMRVSSWVLGGAFVAGVLVAANHVVASTMVRYGATYSTERDLSLALRLEPRVDAAEALANERAFDYRAGDRRARPDAEAISRRDVARHKWNPGVRLAAADAASAVDDLSTASYWIDQQLRWFPTDPLAWAGAAEVALRHGDLTQAREDARKALRIDPSSVTAKAVLAKRAP